MLGWRPFQEFPGGGSPARGVAAAQPLATGQPIGFAGDLSIQSCHTIFARPTHVAWVTRCYRLEIGIGRASDVRFVTTAAVRVVDAIANGKFLQYMQQFDALGASDKQLINFRLDMLDFLSLAVAELQHFQADDAASTLRGFASDLTLLWGLVSTFRGTSTLCTTGSNLGGKVFGWVGGWGGLDE